MAKKATVFSCTGCGGQSPKWLGRCPECGTWNSFIEEAAAQPANIAHFSSGTAPVPIDRVGFESTPRIATGIASFDAVLGGGLVPGSVVLVGGEPGIGKSTLLLQASEKLAALGTLLYVSGEESPKQIALRARRLNTVNPAIHLYAETSIEKIVGEIDKLRPVAVIIDSIQTVATNSNPSSPGSIGQVRDSAGILMSTAKRLGIPIFLVGHITKEGTIAGPKSLEHIVDTVLYFEGDKLHHYRMIRAFKNRFGPVNELAIFEMHDDGLEEVANPSGALIAQRSGAPGSAIVAALEGTRSLLIEVQALVSVSHLGTPRRAAIGIDSSRLSLLLAVLDRKSGGSRFASHDVYVNIAGGLQFDEPAIDLGLIAALVSSERNVPIRSDLAVFGEVGLLGEIRSVSQPETRAREAATLGFRRLIVPQSNAGEIHADLDVIGVKRLDEFVERLFEPPAR